VSHYLGPLRFANLRAAIKMKLLITAIIVAVAFGITAEAKCPAHLSCPCPFKPACSSEESALDKRFQFVYDSKAANFKAVEGTKE